MIEAVVGSEKRNQWVGVGDGSAQRSTWGMDVIEWFCMVGLETSERQFLRKTLQRMRQRGEVSNGGRAQQGWRQM